MRKVDFTYKQSLSSTPVNKLKVDYKHAIESKSLIC